MFSRYNRKKKVNKFLLVGDKSISEIRLRQRGFMRSAFGSFTKNKERIQKFKETGNLRYILNFKTNKKKPAFSIIWLKEILMIYHKYG